MMSWPVVMTTWVTVGWRNQAGVLSTVDAVTAATPMAAMHHGQLPECSALNMFLGNIGGCIGETSYYSTKIKYDVFYHWYVCNGKVCGSNIQDCQACFSADCMPYLYVS